MPNLDWLSLAFWTKDTTSVRDLALIIGGTIGGGLLIWRTINHDRQTKAAKSQARTAEEGRITDRINKAIENLSALRTVHRDVGEVTEPNIEVRIGAIYALERIAQDSERDHIPIMETLCAYVRENSPVTSAINTDYIEQHVNKIMFDRRALLDSRGKKALIEPWRKLALQDDVHHRVGPPTSPRTDIQAALAVISRRSRARIAYERRQIQSDDPNDLGYCLDLRWTNLQGANLYRARLGHAKLANSSLDGADLDSAELDNASLSQASLTKATVRNASFVGAYLGMAGFEGTHAARARFDRAYLGQARFERASLWHARFDGTDCRWTNFRHADFAGASLDGAWLEAADLTETENLEFSQLERAFGDKKTELPNGWNAADFPHWPLEDANGEELERRFQEWSKTRARRFPPFV